MLEEYSVRTIFPIHLQPIAMIMCIIYWLMCLCTQCCKRHNQVGEEFDHDDNVFTQLDRTRQFVRSNTHIYQNSTITNCTNVVRDQTKHWIFQKLLSLFIQCSMYFNKFEHKYFLPIFGSRFPFVLVVVQLGRNYSLEQVSPFYPLLTLNGYFCLKLSWLSCFIRKEIFF